MCVCWSDSFTVERENTCICPFFLDSRTRARGGKEHQQRENNASILKERASERKGDACE